MAKVAYSAVVAKAEAMGAEEGREEEGAEEEETSSTRRPLERLVLLLVHRHRPDH